VDDRQLSKLLSLVLRHRPDRFGVQLDDGGWVEVPALLESLGRHGRPVTRAQLERIVVGDDKQRFALVADRIRANQGHSVTVDLGLAPQPPPHRLYHGTPRSNLDPILTAGLQRSGRHAVHLSADAATALRVGARRGPAVVLTVDAEAMHRAGHVFTRSENGIWLVAAVPPAYLTVHQGPT